MYGAIYGVWGPVEYMRPSTRNLWPRKYSLLIATLNSRRTGVVRMDVPGV